MKKRTRMILIGLCAAVLVFSLAGMALTYFSTVQGDALYEQAVDDFTAPVAPVAPATPTTPDTPDEPTTPETPVAPDSPDAPEAPDEPTQTPETPVTPPSQPVAPVAPPKPVIILEKPDISVDFARLKGINDDIFGWIYIYDTIISYPLLRGVDNQKYLKTTYNNTQSRFGSIFMDMYGSEDFSNRHTIIYGHNIKSGSMFGNLTSYRNQRYAENHPYIFILTKDGYLKYQIFSAHNTDTDQGVFVRSFQSTEQYAEFLLMLKQSSVISLDITPQTSDYVLTLSTCTNTSRKEQRFVVHALLVEDARQAAPEPDAAPEPGAPPAAPESDSALSAPDSTPAVPDAPPAAPESDSALSAPPAAD